MNQEWFDTNRRMWDERVPIHVGGRFYDVAGFKSTRMSLRDFEREDVGDVAGLRLVHLQCHFGLDTLSWATLGAEVTGLDFSRPAIEAARRLAAELEIDARFVVGNVYDAPDLLDGPYDIVYTGLGAINWLPDLARWARVLATLVRPGGVVYVPEFHPLTEMLADDSLAIERPYFANATPTVWEEPGTYADRNAPTSSNKTFEWTHPVSEVTQALLDAGLVLERFREHDFTLFERWPFLVRSGRDTYRLPEGTPSLPLMYSLTLRAPVGSG